MKYLTQEEVNSLPSGTVVEVTWTGGNGPHKYVIEKPPYDTTPLAFIIEKDGRRIEVGELDFVGQEKPYTLVSIVGNPWEYYLD